MAWTDAARAAALAARRAKNAYTRGAQQPNESRYVKLDRWYDRTSRNAIVEPVEKRTGYPMATPSIYVAKMREAKATNMGYFRQDLARELADRRHGPADVREAFKRDRETRIVSVSDTHKNSPGANDLHRSAASSAGKGKKK